MRIGNANIYSHCLANKIPMNNFTSKKIQSLLQRLHAEARAADEPFLAKIEQMPGAERESLMADYRRLYGLARDAFIPIGEDFGRLLYLLTRSAQAKTIVEFGTSFGISTVYLASGLRDNGGGKLITCEMEAAKSRRAQAHLAEAGLSDVVEFRVGDALELLSQGISGPIDVLFLDGAKDLYFQILKLVEPHLRPGALIAADNVNSRTKVNEFTDYIRDPANGYLSVEMPMGDGIEIAARVS
jgi:predicted O-methyltransferase YrrM